jgi:hypothetical protein
MDRNPQEVRREFGGEGRTNVSRFPSPICQLRSRSHSCFGVVEGRGRAVRSKKAVAGEGLKNTEPDRHITLYCIILFTVKHRPDLAVRH